MRRRILREVFVAVLAAAIGLGALLFVEAALHVTHGFAWAIVPLREILRAWTRCSAEGWIVLGLLSVALSYPARARLLRRRCDHPTSTTADELFVLAALGATSSALFVATAIGRIYAGRGPRPSEEGKLALFVAARLERELTTWSIVGAGLALLAVLWGLVGLTWARRESSGSAARIVTIAGLVAVVAATGASLLAWWIAVSGATCNAESMDSEHRYELIVRAGDPLVRGRWVLIAVAAISTAAILIAARRPRRSPSSPRELTAAASLFALGLVAFALTRGADHDALHPIPLWQPSGMISFSDATAASFPPGKEGCDVNDSEAPLASFGDGGWTLDGVRTATAADFGAALAVRKKLWTQLMPGKPFSELLLAAIPAGTSMSLVHPYLQTARDVGYSDLYVLVGRPPRTFATRTLGVIAYRPRLCVVSASEADALPTTGTWGDWAGSLARSLPAR